MSGHGQTQAGHALSPIEEMVSCYPTFNHDIYPYLHEQVQLEFHSKWLRNAEKAKQSETDISLLTFCGIGLSDDCKYTQEYMSVWAWYAQARSKWLQKDEEDEYQYQQEEEQQEEQQHPGYYQHQHQNESIEAMLHRDGTERQKFEQEAYIRLHQWAQAMYNGMWFSFYSFPKYTYHVFHFSRQELYTSYPQKIFPNIADSFSSPHRGMSGN